MKSNYLKVSSLVLALGLGLVGVANAQKAVTADELVRGYLQKNSRTKTTLQYHINDDMRDDASGIRHIYAQQQVNGIFVKDALLGMHISDKYGMTAPENQFVDAKVNATVPSISAENAVRTVMNLIDAPQIGALNIKEQLTVADKKTTFAKGAIAADDIKTRLFYVPNAKTGVLDLAWEVQYFTKDRQNYWVMYVDANTNKVLSKQDMVLHCQFGEGIVTDGSSEELKQLAAEQKIRNLAAAEQMEKAIEANKLKKGAFYEVALPETQGLQKTFAALAIASNYKVLAFPNEAPNDLLSTTPVGGTQTMAQSSTDVAGGVAPFGWHNDGSVEYGYLRGNNVWTFQDPSPGSLGGVPSADPTRTSYPTAGNATIGYTFDYPWDLTKEPDFMNAAGAPNNAKPNTNAAMVNLFYVNNMVHDVFYKFGFNEVGRNFQTSNNGKGASGNDAVLAQAQDGGGTNNANMLTLLDGTAPQMQMFLWTAAIPDSLLQVKTATGGTGSYAAPRKVASLQSALYNAAMEDLPSNSLNLNARPVLDKLLVIVNKNTNAAGTATQGCGTANQGVGLPAANQAAINGNIVIIDRGTCSFVEKVDGAQKSGAVGAIVVNNDQVNPDAIIAMGGTDAAINGITIPSIMISFNQGKLIKEFITAGGAIRADLKRDNPKTPKRDGDFDNGVIAHEYGHGISNRLSPQTATGGSLSGNEQGGEGWSDFWGLFMTATKSDLLTPTLDHPNGVLPTRGIGSYVFYQPITGTGIRPRRYSIDLGVNEYTMAGTTNGGKGIGNAAEITIPHGVGFVWCSMLYEMTQTLIDRYDMQDDKTLVPNDVAGIVTAKGFNLANKLVMEGIKRQIASPSFKDQRDGILKADTALYANIHSCDIWKSFAKRGLGSDAVDLTNAIGDEQDGYGVPAACNPTQVYYSIEKLAPVSIENGTGMQYTLIVKNTSQTNTPATNVVVTDNLPNNVTYAGTFTSKVVGTTLNQAGQQLQFTVPALAALALDTIRFNVSVNTPSASNLLNSYGFETANEGWTPLAGSSAGGVNSTFVRQNNTNAHTGTGHFFCNNGESGGPAYLTSPALDLTKTNKQLRFWHKYDTDANYDGGFLETTVDGNTWTRVAAAQIAENGYTGTLNATFNPAFAGGAWTGGAPYKESAYNIPDNVRQVRFTFAVDAGGGSGTGWFIDDIRIIQNPVFVTNTASVTDPTGGRVKTATAKTLVLPGSALPVELAELKATTEKNTIRLNWATASEINNAGFDVMRKAEGETSFSKIAFVKGAGNSATFKQYTLQDKTVEAGKNYYYYLNQIDNDGKTRGSNVVTARIDLKNVTLNVSPNPANQFANIYLSNVTDRNATLRVLSVDGRVMYQTPASAQDQINLNTSNWAKGVYMVELKAENVNLLQKLVIQ